MIASHTLRYHSHNVAVKQAPTFGTPARRTAPHLCLPKTPSASQLHGLRASSVRASAYDLPWPTRATIPPAQQSWAVRVVEDVIGAIQAGIFPRTDPSSWICSPKFCGHFVSRVRPQVFRPAVVRNCTRDEGRPLGAALQEEAPNHLELLWLRARVVSVKEKARETCQVQIKETSESEPLLTCRNRTQTTSKPGLSVYPGISPRETCLLLGWRPAYRWRDLDPGSCVERENLLHDAKRKPYKWRTHEGGKYRCMQQGRIIP